MRIIATNWFIMAASVAAMSRVGMAWTRTTLATRRSPTIASSLLSRSQVTLFSTTTTEEEETKTTTETTSRLPRDNLNMDVRTIVSNKDVVLSHLKSRRASQETIDAAEEIASNLQAKRVALLQQRDDYLNQRKEASANVGKLMRDRDNADPAEVEEQKAISAQAADNAEKTEEELADVQKTMDALFSSIPNLLDDKVPDGDDENDNEEVSTWGDLDALPEELGWTEDFKAKWHDDVALGLQGYESEAAVQMSGARFVALGGVVAQLERALAMFFLDLHTSEHGYKEMSVPYIVGRSALEGTSQLPKFEEDLFAITPESHTCNGEDAFLIPTAEVPLTNLYAGSILEESDLPLSFVAWTPCFRAEAGSYGRDTKGLIRTHQFQKVELVKITSQADSDEQHELLTQHAEKCLQALELPYRKVRLCSGDIGFSARHCYDLEVWLPGASEYREISSCSNTGDFQARRMGLRYRPVPPPVVADSDDGKKKKKKKKAKKPKPELCHTINGSGLAVGRTLVAVLENYQRPDGSVVVPKVLRPYMGGKEILEAP